LINEVFSNAMSALDPEDAALPQIQSMLPLLLRGVAVHHSGLLPILKEVIEILFCENLVKVLFCTETFAMGLNAPAKVVVFSNFSKWDGTERRVISSGEYIQMAGRAGRRGKDDKGLAIVMMTDKIEPETCKNVMIGEALRLDSQFYLSYNMLLNLYRLEGADVGYLVERSFSQFQRNKGVVEVKSRIAEAEFALTEVETRLQTLQSAATAGVVQEMARLYEEVSELRAKVEELRAILTTPKYLLPYLNAGRLVKLLSGQWVVLLRVQEDKQRNAILNVFDKDEERNIPISQVAAIATIRANIPETNLKAALTIQLDKIVNHERFRESGLPVMDPVKDMKIPECEVAHIVTAIADLKLAISTNSVFKAIQPHLNAPGTVDVLADFFRTAADAAAWRSSALPTDGSADAAETTEVWEYAQEFLRRMSVLRNLEELRKESSRSQSLVLREELRAMRRVLRRMNFIDANNVLTDKGKLGCEVSSCDEVLLTEMVFNNVFEGLTADETVGLLSCLVLDEKSEDTALPEEVERSALGKALAKTREIAASVADGMAECRVPDFDPKLYVEKIKMQMILPVSLWLSGKNFKDVMESTALFEGSVVRVMRRLEELVREVCLAAKAIGHSELEQKLIEARKRLRRGIVFAASLYI
jgi:ATP-dependent RNA helicase DOB1